MRRYRNALVIGVGWIVLAVAYAALAPVIGYHVEWAGATMLLALGAAMGILVLVLDTGGE